MNYHINQFVKVNTPYNGLERGDVVKILNFLKSQIQISKGIKEIEIAIVSSQIIEEVEIPCHYLSPIENTRRRSA